MDVPLTLRHISIPFSEHVLTQTLYIGATVSYYGRMYPNLEPEEQLVVVVGI